MQREINDEIFLGQAVSPFDVIGNSSALDRTVSNYTDAKEKVRKIRELLAQENIMQILLNLFLE